MNASFQLQLEIDLKHTNSPQSDRCFTANLPIGIFFTGVDLFGIGGFCLQQYHQNSCPWYLLNCHS